MTTTATRPRRASIRDADLLNLTFPIAKRQPGEPPTPEDASHVGLTRSLIRDRLNDCGLASIVDEAMLVVSELVTNAVLHSGAREITLTVNCLDGYLRIRVHDGVPGCRPTPQEPSSTEENGRGLWLVESTADSRGGSWGASDDGATTWCNLALAVSQ
ncbi:ATP-binding protein [Streptomyces celluloflavus]|uniref:ATP-binding protein n=1 Tax=Streptomyces celluloflavus TaxID=58344 RepID=UPI00345FA875|nr:ATP-binding protein [Streptomyces celluloflavus]